MNPVKIGLLGLGTVGNGTRQVLERNDTEISRRAGRAIQITQAAVRNLDRPNVNDIQLTNQPIDIVNDSDIAIATD